MTQDTADSLLGETKIGRLHNKRIFIINLLLVGIVVFSFAVFAYFFFNRQVNLLLKQQGSFYLQEVATKSAERLKAKLEGDLAMLKGIALTLGGLEELDHEYWLDELTHDELLGDMQGFGFILPDGKAYAKQFSGLDVSERSYFRSAMQGNSVISDVFIDKVYSKPVLFYVEPIFQKGVVVAAVVFGIMTEEFEKYLLMPAFAGEGTIHLVSTTGSIILKLGRASIPKRLSLASLQEDFAAGRSGIIRLEGDNPRTLAYAPVGVKGWSLLLEVPNSFLLKTRKQTALYALVMTLLFGLLMLIFPYNALFRRRRHETALLKVAYIDPLTGIANRSLFVELAERLLEKEGPNYACIVLNIRRFKLINDLFGYTYGDALLKEIASMLPAFCRGKELYGRRGGDRFLLLLEQEGAEDRARTILAAMNQIILPDTARFKLEIVGGVFFLHKPLPMNICIDRASLAIDQLAHDHSKSYLVYDETIREQLLDESELIRDFPEALHSGQFYALLQPKFNMKTGEVVGSEALVRWNHPTKGFLSPLQFIPVFEENNLITQLDMFVLKEVCTKLRQWQDEGLEPLPVSVNQSRAHLDNPFYIPELLQVVGQFGLEPSLLEFEMTESIFLENLDHLKVVVASLRNEGFKVSIDDFGSGYSSLSILKNITVDYLKLDREFLMEAEDDGRSQKVIRSVIQMAHDLGILIVAEGVETKAQADMLVGMDCLIAQGYYYERPITMDAFEKLLKNPPGKPEPL
ncbi:MAG: EAL domain-containing protein [Sphaerochaeta sp.]|nr:EAL domain-containing protein [Sphaerochaeta sp.]